MLELILLENKDPIYHIVTPITPYFICDHYIATEIKPQSLHRYICKNIRVKANDLLDNHNYHLIKEGDIIQCQIDFFDHFYNVVLPYLVTQGVHVILITSQWHLPQIHQNEKTDHLLEHPNILLWISQNPIYNHPKYMAFPYGICQTQVEEYISFLRSNPIMKDTKITNQCARVHNHLPSNHIRKAYDLFGKDSGPPVEYSSFLSNIARSEFVISTAGDRDDCFRHYECIGLGAIPVSNTTYKDIFGSNMIYSNPEEMVKMVSENKVEYEYVSPNRDIITIKYWVDKIGERLKGD